MLTGLPVDALPFLQQLIEEDMLARMEDAVKSNIHANLKQTGRCLWSFAEQAPASEVDVVQQLMDPSRTQKACHLGAEDAMAGPRQSQSNLRRRGSAAADFRQVRHRRN